jgi:hypothetical protein
LPLESGLSGDASGVRTRTAAQRSPTIGWRRIPLGSVPNQRSRSTAAKYRNTTTATRDLAGSGAVFEPGRLVGI